MPRFYFKIAVQLNSEGVPTRTGSRTYFLCLGELVLIHQVDEPGTNEIDPGTVKNP